MKAERAREQFLRTINERDRGLMKTGNRCFHIGIGGGCGLRCAAFCDGECEEPQEFSSADINAEFDAAERRELELHYPHVWQMPIDADNHATQTTTRGTK